MIVCRFHFRRFQSTVNSYAPAVVLITVVFAAAGCASGGKARPRSASVGCDSVAGVFSNLGRLDRDPAKYAPEDLQTFLLEHLETLERLPRRFRGANDVSVALRHVSDGELRYAVIDASGAIVHRGTSTRYAACSRGVLERVKKIELKLEDGWLGSDETYTQSLYIAVAGELVVGSKSAAYGLFLGFPILSKQGTWSEYPSDSRFDVGSFDF